MSILNHMLNCIMIKLYLGECFSNFLIDLVVVKFLFYVVCVGVLVLVQNSTLKSK